MGSQYVSIEGIREGRSLPVVPLRQEIRTLQLNNPDMFNLYILGLQYMQSRPKTDKLSWFQVAGIHGRPYTAWDNVLGIGNEAGYCTHSSILFPTWHRPYLALYEQALLSSIKLALMEFPAGPIKSKFTQLIPSFRMPYWDWAMNSAVPDIVLKDETIEIETAKGRQRVRNPLYCYSFTSIDETEFPESYFNTWRNTVRYPNLTRVEAADKGNAEEVALEMQAAGTFPGNPYSPLNFEFFSNDGWNNNRDLDYYDSLESIHNTIHNTIGGGGHMSYPDYAAFDPIFWLHHTNVDRIFALWQVLHPGSYVGEQRSRYLTFWSQEDQIENYLTPLVPFHKHDLAYWTSQACRDVKTFGSTYPELIDWENNTSPDQVRLNVERAIKQLYGQTASETRRWALSQGASLLPVSYPVGSTSAGGFSLPQNDGPGDESGSQYISSLPTDPAHKKNMKPIHTTLTRRVDWIIRGPFYEYYCNIQVDKYAVGGSFNCHIFLGDFNIDPMRRAYDKNLVGTFSVFANDPNTTGCKKCLNDAKSQLVVCGSIPLTGALLAKIPRLKSLALVHVVPYLRNNLHWRCNKPDQTHISRDEIPSLKVGVFQASIPVLHTREFFPSYGPLKQLYRVTAGRKAGLAEGDRSLDDYKLSQP
ncbi:hypothetical protein HOY80DRAFT_881126 [Tuber brumale]|nr:hypothetical protein HOY80DRAFT_881126 [Tuber brumale]